MSDYIIEPIKKIYKDNFFQQKSYGFLLYGPPGCGKTLIAQAVANESGAKFIGVKGPEIFDKFLGESERSIRSIFSKARSLAPSIIFFDEIDSIGNKRNGPENLNSNGANDRVLNQLLTEMDGFESNKSVFIIAATNRPDIIDRALLRPGRIDKNLFIPLPNQKERIRILKTILKKFDSLPYLNLNLFSKVICKGFSGADLMSVAREAFINLEKERIYYLTLQTTCQKIEFSLGLFFGTKNILEGYKNVQKNLNLKK
jgi:ribosome biogenesis ATPase